MTREYAEGLTEFLGMAVMMMVPGYFVLQVWALMRLERKWRIAAAAPLILAVPAALWCLYALSQESNLWPLVFILFAPIGTVYLAILIGLNRLWA
jgi:hypothetical protein